MEILGIIFDMDMTLIDTSSLISYRQNRQWNKVYHNIPKTRIYPGIINLVNELKRRYNLGIVTSSPRKYANKLIRYHNINIPILVAYHDTRLHKPAPDPIRLGCQKLACPRNKIISIGDDKNDIIASNIAGTTSVLASWGISSPNSHQADFEFTSVEDLKHYLLN
jgi:HAD superfamily hydrolase (TIGR01549 family)